MAKKKQGLIEDVKEFVDEVVLGHPHDDSEESAQLPSEKMPEDDPIQVEHKPTHNKFSKFNKGD